MSDFYENLLRATNNLDDITTEKYGTITSKKGNYCTVKETDNDLEHTNVPILNGAELNVGDKVIIGFLNNSIYDVICYGAIGKTIHDNTKQDTLISGTNIKTINHQSLLGSGNITIEGGGGGVTIQTSWGSTTSDSKVPSEKLTKDTLDTKIAKSSTTGLVKNDGTIMTSGTGSTNYSAGNHTHSGYVSGSKVTSWSSTVSDSNIPSEKLVKNTIDGLSIPTKTSDLTNDGDGTNVFVKNNDSRLTDSRTPTSHTHGNLTNDGKVGSNANYIVVTGTGGAITSVQKLGNITYDGKIGSTSGKPLITTTSGTVTTGSFGTSSGTFAEGNHTHSGYVSATKVTSWQSPPSDSNVPSEKLVSDTFDAIEDLIGNIEEDMMS